MRVGLKRLLYPPICLFCLEEILDERFHTLCEGCFGELEFLEGFEKVTNHAPFCRHIAAPFEHGGVAEVVVEGFKAAGRSYLADAMAGFMLLKWLEGDFPEPDVIVPVPASPVTSFQRGYQPSVLLAETIGELLNKPVWNGLSKEVAFLKQAHLSKEEREKGKIAPLYLVKDPKVLEDKTVLLVDDVMTTGATLNQAARLLCGGYPKAVDALVFTTHA